jgi:hypothetical protein
MPITETDNRIRLTTKLVDFDDVVGVTGQEHDSFPSPGQNPRYDTMRSFLIGLLSNQSSKEAPVQKRTGALQYDRNTRTMLIWDGSNWANLSEYIKTFGNILTDLFEFINQKLESANATMTFSGIAITSSISIPVPEAVRTALADVSGEIGIFVYVNGKIIDPSKVRFSNGCPVVILLDSDVALPVGSRFTVVFKVLGGTVESLLATGSQ